MTTSVQIPNERAGQFDNALQSFFAERCQNINAEQGDFWTTFKFNDPTESEEDTFNDLAEEFQEEVMGSFDEQG